MPLGLPIVPVELKSIAPYVQRADEVKQTEPIIAYWCIYHAVQVGISLGAKGLDARKYLVEILGKLESMKAEVVEDESAKDIVEHEIQSAAYVESFALKVFSLADNTDRAGKATRATAKQFLAASNFLEVLNVFDKAVREDSYDDKIRYAKWKATDIARAFREGRQPTPGPAGGLDDVDDSSMPNFPAPPSHLAKTDTMPLSSSIVTQLDWDGSGTPRAAPIPLSPDSESVESVLGTAPSTEPLLPDTSETEVGWHPIVENEQLRPADARAPVHRADSTAAIIDGDAGATELSGNAEALGLSASAGHRADTPLIAPVHTQHAAYLGEIAPTPAPAPSAPVGPPMGVPPSVPPVTSLPPGFVPTSASLPPAATHAHSAGVPPPPILFAQPVAPSHNQPPVTPAFLPPPELTPQLIGKIQRHCRFAVSSLDYDDAEQARKELRAALLLLGG